MTSPTQSTWVCANSERQWTGNPGVLQSMDMQRVGHDLGTEQLETAGSVWSYTWPGPPTGHVKQLLLS